MVTRFDPVAFLARVGDGKTVTAYKSGEVIFKQGEPAEVVFYLQSGAIKETVASWRSQERTVGVLEPGQFFGTGCLDGSALRHSSTRAIKASVATAITVGAMRRMLDAEPAFAQLFIAYLLHHNSRIEAEKVNLLFNQHEKRLAQHLLLLARVTEGPPRLISADITQVMLANMIGATRQRVNYFLNRFRKLRFIEYTHGDHGGIRVNPSLLAAVLQDKVSITDDKEVG